MPLVDILEYYSVVTLFRIILKILFKSVSIVSILILFYVYISIYLHQRIVLVEPNNIILFLEIFLWLPGIFYSFYDIYKTIKPTKNN
jgi:hypothetical protein